MNISSACSDPISSNVGVVDCRPTKTDQSVESKNRRQYGDIKKMTGRHPGVISDQNVPVVQLINRDFSDQIFGSCSQGVDVPRRPNQRLRDHSGVCVK